MKTETLELVKFDAPELNGLEKSKADQIRSTFEPMAEMLADFEESFNSVISESKNGITKEITKKAKQLRIDIGKVRIQTEKIRKEQKEEYLRAGKAIDGVSNILKWAVTDKENKLKEIENYFEIQEQKKLDALQNERVAMLSEYVEDAHERNLSGMEEDVWNAYFLSKKKEYEDRLEAERKAEEERIERERLQKLHTERKDSILHLWQFVENRDQNFSEFDDEGWKEFLGVLSQKKEEFDKEQERIKAENERLQREQEKARQKIEAERKAAKEKLKKEREDRERIQEELRKREEEDRKAKEAEEAIIQSELNKGDSEKVVDLITDLNSLKTKYEFKSKKNKKMYSDVSTLIDKIIDHIGKYRA